jgi:protein involved in polysaccharide export with SLBB domain
MVLLSVFCLWAAAATVSAVRLSPQESQSSTDQIAQQEAKKKQDEAAGDQANEQIRLETNEEKREREQERVLRNLKPAPLPAEPDTEFQKFVTVSTGLHLPFFGQNLFQYVPSTFAPVERIPVPADYVIGPGDELLIRVWGQINMNYRTVVDRTGSIYLAKVGSFTVAGLKYDHLHDYLQTELSRMFKNFELSATTGELRSIQIFVVGQVRRPGTYTVSSLSTLVNALFASGGPSKQGSMRRIQLKRDGRVVTTMDLYDLIVHGDKSQDVPLLPGDVIYVPPVGPLVAMAGSIRLPGIYELKQQGTLKDVIDYAGGLSNTAAGSDAILERIDNRQARSVAEVPLSDEGLASELRDGDVVRFLPISPKFENAVTLRGNVAWPGRYPWREGMRVKDLIPGRDFLITREYWEGKNQLVGLQKAEAPEDQGSALASQVQSTRVAVSTLKNEVKRPAADINWEYAVIQRLDPQKLIPDLLPFNLGKAVEGDPAQNLSLQPGDVVTVFSQADIEVPIDQRTKFVHLEGEFAKPGIYQLEPKETLRHLVTRVGGFTSDAYLYGAVFTRESNRIAQQKRLDEYLQTLEQSIERSASTQRGLPGSEDVAAQRDRLEAQRRLVERLRQLKATGRLVLQLPPNSTDPAALPDLALEDGDSFIIPARPATVNLVGAVYNSNSFVFERGKKVRAYLRLSGGITGEGDKKRIFVVRADGSAVGREDNRDLLSMRLMPGDSVIVPEKLEKGNTIRALKDWTQIFAQLALGAAAVNVLK